MRIAYLLFSTLFFVNTLFSSNTLQMSDTGMVVPKEIFFKIAQYSVPNLVCPTHPAEIKYQDDALKTYRLVCTTWRDLLDQRVDFDSMNRLFCQTYKWNDSRFFVYYKRRLDTLTKSYLQENAWFVNQRASMQKNIHSLSQRDMNAELKTILNSNHEAKVPLELPLACKMYRKIMKSKLALYDYNGFLMLKKYLCNGGFLNTYSLIRLISLFYIRINQNSCEATILKELSVICDLTDIFSRLFEGFIRRDENYYSSLLIEEIKIDYRRFLHMMHLSFCNRVKSYEYNINFCSQGQMFSTSHFFNIYKSSFTLKDQNNRSFLYYLLLYSKDLFFNIQIKLLVSFIKGIEKKLSDYSYYEQTLHLQLFEQNFLPRFKNKFLDDEAFLKAYFRGI